MRLAGFSENFRRYRRANMRAKKGAIILNEKGRLFGLDAFRNAEKTQKARRGKGRRFFAPDVRNKRPRTANTARVSPGRNTGCAFRFAP